MRESLDIYGDIIAKRRKRLLTNPARLPLPDASEEQGYVLEVIKAVVMIDLSEQTKKAAIMLRKTMSSVLYINNVDIRDLGKCLHA